MQRPKQWHTPEQIRAMAQSKWSEPVETVGWVGDARSGVVRLIDQTRLPGEFVRIDLTDVPGVWEAIKSLRVRGAPAIGIAAAFGAVLGARSAPIGDPAAVRAALRV